jgi:hypothetical protein
VFPAAPTHPNPLLRFVRGDYVDRVACDAAFERMHRRDAVGDRLHLALACVGMFLVVGPVTVTELAFAPMAVFFFVRVANTAPVWIHGFGQPFVLAGLALAAWAGVTLLWSPDPAGGVDEITRLRWILLAGLVYPVIERRRTLILALALGFLAAGVAQQLSRLDALRPPFAPRHPGRVSGWWDPVVAGSMQCAAAGLFLPAALRGVGKDRWIGLTGLAIALAGVLSSGTRGAWIAAMILLAVAGPFALRHAERGARRTALGAAAAGVLVLAGVAFVQRDGLTLRLEQARSELAQAANGRLDTDTGARVGVMGLSLESGLTHPWGLGVGGLAPAAAARFGEAHRAAGMSHAHSTPLHLLGVLGVPGLAIGVLAAWALLRSGAAASPREPARALEAGVPYAVAGLLLAGLFDAVHLNTQTAALLGVLGALSPAYLVRPSNAAPPVQTPAA